MMLPVIDPIVPVLSREVPHGQDWRYELKLDGFRGMLYVEAGTAFFRSKTKRVMRRFQDLADRLASLLPIGSAVLDGEIIVIEGQLPDFCALLQARGEPEYAAFDLLWLNGRDLRGLPFSKRKRRLRALLRRQSAVAYVEAHRSRDLFEGAARLDLEAVTAKRAADPYTATTTWWKNKNRDYAFMTKQSAAHRTLVALNG